MAVTVSVPDRPLRTEVCISVLTTGGTADIRVFIYDSGMELVDYATQRAKQGIVAPFADGWLLAMDGGEELAMLVSARFGEGWEVVGRDGYDHRRYETDTARAALAAWLRGEPGSPVLCPR